MCNCLLQAVTGMEPVYSLWFWLIARLRACLSPEIDPRQGGRFSLTMIVSPSPPKFYTFPKIPLYFP